MLVFLYRLKSPTGPTPQSQSPVKCPWNYSFKINSESDIARGPKPFKLTRVNEQFDAQFLYSKIRLLQPSTCFEESFVHHEEVNCINTASGIVTLL